MDPTGRNLRGDYGSGATAGNAVWSQADFLIGSDLILRTRKLVDLLVTVDRILRRSALLLDGFASPEFAPAAPNRSTFPGFEMSSVGLVGSVTTSTINVEASLVSIA